MFIIRKKSCSNKTIRMPDNMIKIFDAIAHKKQVSFNSVVIQCCEYILSRLSEEEKDFLRKKGLLEELEINEEKIYIYSENKNP